MAVDVSAAKILQAVEVLRKHVSEHCDSKKKKPLLHDKMDKSLFVQITLKRIPKLKLYKMIKVSLPHSLISNTSEVCLIVGDLDKNDRKADISKDIEYYENLLKENCISQITQVFPLRQLRTEYKQFEAKRRLIEHFDVFLADNRIYQCLPRLLGKFSFKKRKVPIQINIRTSRLKEQIERALSEKIFMVSGRGNTCASEVAYLSMDDDKIIENVQAAAEKLFEEIPGGVDNVMGMYLRSFNSIAVPIYMSYGNPDNVDLGTEEHHEDVEAEEITTLNHGKVKVFKDGRIRVIKEYRCLQKEAESDANSVSYKHVGERDSNEASIKVGVAETGSEKCSDENDNEENMNSENVSEEDDEEVCDDDDIVKTSKMSNAPNRNLNSNNIHLSKIIKKEEEIVSKRNSKVNNQMANKTASISKKRIQGSLEEKKKFIKEETHTDEDFIEFETKAESEESSDEGDNEENMDSENASEEDDEEISDDDDIVETNKKKYTSNRTVPKKKVMESNGNLSSINVHLSKDIKKEGEIVSKRKSQVGCQTANNTASFSKKRIQTRLEEKKKLKKEKTDTDEDFTEFDETRAESEGSSDESDSEEFMDSEDDITEKMKRMTELIKSLGDQQMASKIASISKEGIQKGNLSFNDSCKKENETVSEKKKPLVDQQLVNTTPSILKKKNQDRNTPLTDPIKKENETVSEKKKPLVDQQMVNTTSSILKKKNQDRNTPLTDPIKKEKKIVGEKDKSLVDHQKVSKSPASSKKRNLDRNVSFNDSIKSQKKRKVRK